MRDDLTLTPAQLADIADTDGTQTTAERADRILQFALDANDLETLRLASLSSRDAVLLAIRSDTFGDKLPSRLTCPTCESQLALDLPRASVPLPQTSGTWHRPEVSLVCGDVSLRLRSPDSAAISAAANCASVEDARTVLIQHCVVGASRGEQLIAPEQLEDADIQAAGVALLQADPGLEPSVDVTCASCGHAWSPVFDAAHFLWREIEVAGSEILDDVHELATAYGWTEDQILTLSTRRRQSYVRRLRDE